MKHADPNTIVVTLTPDQMERVEERVRTGEYASPQAIVLEALELWEERNALDESPEGIAWLKHEYALGLASGPALDVGVDELLAQFKAELKALG
jgi:Arc/MetJ-type ribon-helix-helix transcriptional regulator